MDMDKYREVLESCRAMTPEQLDGFLETATKSREEFRDEIEAAQAGFNHWTGCHAAAYRVKTERGAHGVTHQ